MKFILAIIGSTSAIRLTQNGPSNQLPACFIDGTNGPSGTACTPVIPANLSQHLPALPLCNGSNGPNGTNCATSLSQGPTNLPACFVDGTNGPTGTACTPVIPPSTI